MSVQLRTAAAWPPCCNAGLPQPALAAVIVVLRGHRHPATTTTSTTITTTNTPEAIEQERSSSDAFSAQPFYYMELACLLLEHAKACFDSDHEYMQVCARM